MLLLTCNYVVSLRKGFLFVLALKSGCVIFCGTPWAFILLFIVNCKGSICKYLPVLWLFCAHPHEHFLYRLINTLKLGWLREVSSCFNDKGLLSVFFPLIGTFAPMSIKMPSEFLLDKQF